MKRIKSRNFRILITLSALLAALVVFPSSIFAAGDDYPN